MRTLVDLLAWCDTAVQTQCAKKKEKKKEIQHFKNKTKTNKKLWLLCALLKQEKKQKTTQMDIILPHNSATSF